MSHRTAMMTALAGLLAASLALPARADALSGFGGAADVPAEGFEDGPGMPMDEEGWE